MEIFQSIILGAIQGLTEFLPISSSGHLVWIPKVLKWQDKGLLFDIALHLGTFLAVLIYFRKEWVKIIKGVFKKKGIFWQIVVATIPAATAGVFLEQFVGTVFRDILWVAVFSIITGFFFLLAEKFYDLNLKNKKKMEGITFKDALWIGVAQIFALFPGISRSGVTIIAGMFRSIKRVEATKFSFLIGTVIIFGTGLYHLIDLIKMDSSGNNFLSFVFGFITAFFVGYLSIKFMIKFLERNRLTIFAVYLILIGACLIVFRWL